MLRLAEEGSKGSGRLALPSVTAGGSRAEAVFQASGRIDRGRGVYSGKSSMTFWGSFKGVVCLDLKTQTED